MSDLEHQTRWLALTDLSELLADSTLAELQYDNAVWSEWPAWFVELLTKLHAATRGTTIEFLTTNLQPTPDGGGEVIAISDNHVIRAVIDGELSTTVDIWSRQTLNQISVLAVDPYVAAEAPAVGYANWPAGLSVQLRYQEQPVLTVPFAQASPKCVAGFEALYPGLVNDLPHRVRR